MNSTQLSNWHQKKQFNCFKSLEKEKLCFIAVNDRAASQTKIYEQFETLVSSYIIIHYGCSQVLML